MPRHKSKGKDVGKYVIVRSGTLFWTELDCDFETACDVGRVVSQLHPGETVWVKGGPEAVYYVRNWRGAGVGADVEGFDDPGE